MYYPKGSKFGKSIYLLTSNCGKLVLAPYCSIRKHNPYYSSTRINPRKNLVRRLHGR